MDTSKCFKIFDINIEIGKIIYQTTHASHFFFLVKDSIYYFSTLAKAFRV